MPPGPFFSVSCPGFFGFFFFFRFFSYFFGRPAAGTSGESLYIVVDVAHSLEHSLEGDPFLLQLFFADH